jgi:hypothetical protein
MKSWRTQELLLSIFALSALPGSGLLAQNPPEPPPPPVMMPTSAKPEFSVATIKPSNPDAPRGGYGFRGQDVTTTNVTVNWLIKFAYNVHARQIAGGAAWLDSAKYDVIGRPDTPGQPSRDQMKLMLQTLLADRFQLKFHTEKRELPVYAIGGAQDRHEDHRERGGSQCFSGNRFRTRAGGALPVWPQHYPRRGGERLAEQRPG